MTSTQANDAAEMTTARTEGPLTVGRSDTGRIVGGFVDALGHRCMFGEKLATAAPQGQPGLWLGLEGACMLLTVEHVRALLPYLQRVAAASENEPYLTDAAKMVLAILCWEMQREEAVTVDEVVARLGMSKDQAATAFAELIMHKMVDVSQPAYERSGT